MRPVQGNTDAIDAVFQELTVSIYRLTVRAVCRTLTADNQEKGESSLSVLLLAAVKHSIIKGAIREKQQDCS